MLLIKCRTHTSKVSTINYCLDTNIMTVQVPQTEQGTNKGRCTQTGRLARVGVHVYDHKGWCTQTRGPARGKGVGFSTGFFVYVYLYRLFKHRYVHIWKVTIWEPQEMFLPYLHQFWTIFYEPGLVLKQKHRTIPVPVTGTVFIQCFCFKTSPGS